MYKKGNVGQVGAIILFIIFILNWFIWLGSWVSAVGQAMVTENSLTGIEAFFLANLNFFIMIFMFLGMLGFMYFAGGE